MPLELGQERPVGVAVDVAAEVDEFAAVSRLAPQTDELNTPSSIDDTI